MIKVGISGCGSLRAAELLRVLINHPDLELKWVSGGCPAGTRLDQIVPGIIGECDLTLSSVADLAEVDLVFLCGTRNEVAARLSSIQLPDELRVIDLSGSHNLDCGPEKPWIYGLSEMQRRVLVHEAHLVTVPGSAATAALLALMPMARNMSLNNPLSVSVAVGTAMLPDKDKTLDGLSIDDWARDQQEEVKLALAQCQTGFDQPVSLTVTPLAERRMLAAAVRFKCDVKGDMIRQLYEAYYEDHNFVFLVDRPIVAADVENTNKCLIQLYKDESSGLLTVNAVMDVLLKGSVGTAVHAMNLMFGLHERVGLSLKGVGC